MKYVDEFRNADLARAVSAEISSLVTRTALQDHGGLRRPHPHHLPPRHKGSATGSGRAGARPRLPGLRAPDGPGGRGHSHSRTPRGHLHLLRGHDARPRLEREPAGGQGRRRRHPHGVLAAGRPADRAREPRPRSRLLRHRVRDHGPFHGAHVAAGEEGGHRELLRVLQPRHHRAAGACAPDSPDLRLDAFIGPGTSRR